LTEKTDLIFECLERFIYSYDVAYFLGHPCVGYSDVGGARAGVPPPPGVKLTFELTHNDFDRVSFLHIIVTFINFCITTLYVHTG